MFDNLQVTNNLSVESLLGVTILAEEIIKQQIIEKYDAEIIESMIVYLSYFRKEKA